MHSSTSPQYAIIASCDVAAAMMEPPGGTALVEESILEAMNFRRAMRKVDADYGQDWWFKVWGPDALAEEGTGERDDWLLHAQDGWHGFGAVADGFNMLDPIKSTIVTPGLNINGDFDATGIPAAIVTRFLAEHGVIVEKTGLYSFFIMFTIGITKGRWNTLVTALQQFKDDYDRNQPLWRILPEFVAQNPRYERIGLRDLCQQIHEAYRAQDVARLTTEMYLSDLQPAMTPTEAYAKMAHREIERVEIDQLEGASRRAGHAVSARHSAAHSGRAFQRPHHALPAVRPRLQSSLPWICHRRAWAGDRNRCQREQALFRGLRDQHGLRSGRTGR